jgi:glutamate 5-kinase
MTALGVHQLDQRHPRNEVNPVATVAYKSQTGHSLKSLRISSAFNHNETVEKNQQQRTFLPCGKANRISERLRQIAGKRSSRISQQKATAGDPLEILIIVDLNQLTDLFLL